MQELEISPGLPRSHLLQQLQFDIFLERSEDGRYQIRDLDNRLCINGEDNQESI